MISSLNLNKMNVCTSKNKFINQNIPQTKYFSNNICIKNNKINVVKKITIHFYFVIKFTCF